eukprot:1331560-Amorphochlora_amoeboformis.AAC.1
MRQGIVRDVVVFHYYTAQWVRKMSIFAMGIRVGSTLDPINFGCNSAKLVPKLFFEVGASSESLPCSQHL